MEKSLLVIKLEQEHTSELFKEGLKTDMIFREIQRDTKGKSGSRPTWGYVYKNENGKMKKTPKEQPLVKNKLKN